MKPLTLAVFLMPTIAGSMVLLFKHYRSTVVLDPAAVFAELYTNCRLYVEEYADFDTTGLNEGALHETTTRSYDRRPLASVFHHPNTLFVVEIRDKPTDTDSGKQKGRRCDIGLSGYGERPPESVVGLVVLKYFSERARLLHAESHVSYEYKFMSPMFELRAVDPTPNGCSSRSVFSIDADQGTFNVTVLEDTQNDRGLGLTNTCKS